MKFRFLTIALALATTPTFAADDAPLTRLILCKDSWYDWKDDAARMKALGEYFRARFAPHGNDPYFLPKTNVTVLGLHVEQAYPDSVGMGVGFSLLVSAPFDKARTLVEGTLGKKLQHCDHSDGTNACELEIADKRDITLATGDDAKNQTLIGCYYFYEK